MSLDILKEEIKHNKLRNIYLFYGPEEYLKKYYISCMEKILLTEDLMTLNKVVFEDKADQKAIIDTCETMPVFSDKKMVIVKKSGLFKSSKKTEKSEKKDTGKTPKFDLVSYLSTIPDTTCLVFYEEEIDKRTKLADAVKKQGLLVEFTYQKPAELVKWVTRIFKSGKKEIDPVTASQLIEFCEQGMTEILNEVNKVMLFTGTRPKITAADIEKVCTKSVKSRIFDLTDAIAEKNTLKALKLLNDMVVLKEPMPKILFMIARQFRQVLEMKLLTQSGLSQSEAAGKMGITPYAAGKIAKQANGYTVEKLKCAIEESLKLDVDIKTGRMNDRVAAEILITEFSSK